MSTPCLAMMSASCHIARADGVAEGVHLRAVVVDVELTLDVVTGVVHNAAKGVAQRGPAAMADVHGADGVGGNELDLGLRPPPTLDLAKSIPFSRASPKMAFLTATER